MAGTVTGRVCQVSISSGGVPKLPVESAFVDVLGLQGDAHNDTENHGGPRRAVCIYSLELIERLRAEAHPVVPGGMGENLTVTGLDWEAVVPGTQLLVGSDLLLEVTGYTTPCYKIADNFSDGRFARVSQKTHPGESRVYARVIEPGAVRRGDTVRVLEVGAAE